MPILRTPFHLSYLLFLSKVSPLVMTAYLRTALSLCRMAVFVAIATLIGPNTAWSVDYTMNANPAGSPWSWNDPANWPSDPGYPDGTGDTAKINFSTPRSRPSAATPQPLKTHVLFSLIQSHMPITPADRECSSRRAYGRLGRFYS